MSQLFYMWCLFAVLAAVQGKLDINCAENQESALCYKDITTHGLPATAAQINVILSAHNNHRRNAKPTASDMFKVIWDEDIATGAFNWAKQCTFGHDSYKARSLPGYGIVGQNAFAGSAKPTWDGVVNQWYKEVKDFTYGQTSTKDVGHYTQIMYAQTARIGCGGAYCPESSAKYIYICNYNLGQSNYLTPYKLGETCAACPNSCKDKLCDCNGKICKYGGTLDVNTCTCKCDGILYVGDTCGQKTCPAKDMWMCPQWKDYCKTYGTYVSNRCPYMCGEC